MCVYMWVCGCEGGRKEGERTQLGVCLNSELVRDFTGTSYLMNPILLNFKSRC